LAVTVVVATNCPELVNECKNLPPLFVIVPPVPACPGAVVKVMLFDGSDVPLKLVAVTVTVYVVFGPKPEIVIGEFILVPCAPFDVVAV
jgi:hypothetical protein